MLEAAFLMVPFLIALVILSLLVGLLSSWRRNRKLLLDARNATQVGASERANELEKANQDLKAEQEELQRRWQYLAEAQRLSHSGTFGWKVSSGELVWSDETYRILGFTRETNPSLDLVFDRIHPEDVPRVRQLSDRAAQNGMDLEVEHRILLPGGVIKYVHAVAHAGRDRSGNLEYVGVVTDITERKRAEEERQALSRNLQESKARLEEAQHVAHMGHYYWDLIANRVIWSDELYRIYGLTPQEGPIDMAMVREMIHPDDRDHVFREAEEAVRGGLHSEAEHRVVRPNGDVRNVQGLGTVKIDASGRAYEMFGTVQDITDRKRAEEERQALSRELQEIQTWLEEAQRVTHVGYWVWDLETNRLIWSDETYRIFGLTPREDPIDLEKVREMIHPDDREIVFRTAQEAIRSGARADCEHRLLRPDGEMRIVHSLGDLKKDSSGRPYQMFGTTQDITDRKRAEEALQRSRFYLSEGERLAHMGSWASNDLGICWSKDLGMYWSDEVYKIFGLQQKNGHPTLDQYLAAIHPDDRASMVETIRVMHEKRSGCDITKRIVRPEGEVRYVRCVGVPVVEDGVFNGFHGTTMDVTEHELLTQELRREQAYLAEAQRLTHTGSWAANFVTGRNFHLSDETVRMHGFNPGDAIPFEGFFNTVHTEDLPGVRAALETATRTGTDYDIEYRICRADNGQIRYFRSLGHHTPSGQIGDFVGTTMDITERKHAEQERERLRQMEADLAHINRVNMLGELAAALAHEIKQPIAASITSASALLRWLAHDPPDLERARAAATRIEQDGNRAADVINRLRSFYKKGPPPEREMVDVKEIIQEMTVLLDNEAMRYSVTIHSELDANMPNVLADRVQLQQVFMNLMLNAIEAMKDTGGELTITSGLNREGHLLISISDTGLGLPAENGERIFDAFHTTKAQGTGMGLSITRSILESYGGRIWATANQELGATFHFTLPIEAEAHG